MAGTSEKVKRVYDTRFYNFSLGSCIRQIYKHFFRQQISCPISRSTLLSLISEKALISKHGTKEQRQKCASKLENDQNFFDASSLVKESRVGI